MKDHNDKYLRKIADGCQGEKRAELAKAELVARLRQRRADAGPGHPLAVLSAAVARSEPIYAVEMTPFEAMEVVTSFVSCQDRLAFLTDHPDRAHFTREDAERVLRDSRQSGDLT